jgi:hypothetical protein
VLGMLQFFLAKLRFPMLVSWTPLSLNKLTKPQVQSIVDRMASMLPGWKAELMNRAGRALHV